MEVSLQRGFANERLLYRLERSAAGERFILKGAMLFILWSDTPHRTTKDVDLLCRGDNSIAEIEAVFREGLVLSQIRSILHDFLMPPTIAIGAGVEFNRFWSSALGWQIV